VGGGGGDAFVGNSRSLQQARRREAGSRAPSARRRLQPRHPLPRWDLVVVSSLYQKNMLDTLRRSTRATHARDACAERWGATGARKRCMKCPTSASPFRVPAPPAALIAPPSATALRPPPPALKKYEMTFILYSSCWKSGSSFLGRLPPPPPLPRHRRGAGRGDGRVRLVRGEGRGVSD
jgi:hypothetical protein